MSSTTIDVPGITENVEIGRDSFPGHVLAEIARTTGPQPPCPGSEQILLSYWDRLGPERALAVCSAAFGEHGGYWQGAPITPRRFQAAHDSYFTEPILAAAPGD
jgi:hypothetical protein